MLPAVEHLYIRRSHAHNKDSTKSITLACMLQCYVILCLSSVSDVTRYSLHAIINVSVPFQAGEARGPGQYGRCSL